MRISGRVARAFLHSKLTPLITAAALGAGALAMIATPREEEPQISVPMIDVFAELPGASPAEVENLIVRPVEQRMWEIPGVEHVYSTAMEGGALVTVRFTVGADQEQSITKVHAKLFAAMDQAPPGARPPLVRPHTIDDVPILTLTLHSERYDSNELRAIAVHLEAELRALPDVAQTFITGGRPGRIRVLMNPARLAAQGVTPGHVAQTLGDAGARVHAGEFATADRVIRIDAGAPLESAADVGSVVVAAPGGAVVHVRDVADVREDFGEPVHYVTHAARDGEPRAAVTIALAKRRGANATKVATAALERVENARGRLLPPDVDLTVTRNYGETAAAKAAELMFHLVIATLSVALLILVFLGWREAAIVLVAIPVTLAITLFVFHTLGYTLNRVTLFALIFSIGILVDDAIVVVENVYRHLRMRRGSDAGAVAIEAVDEVGNPTILATFTVIAAILPMAFVTGMSGPYMRPIPIGASAAMLASLAVAFIITPYLALRLLRASAAAAMRDGHAPGRPHRFARLYARIMSPLLQHRARRFAFYAITIGALLGAGGLLALRAVEVKMLPYDNKSEFQVILDLPEGSTIETSHALGRQVAAYLRTLPEVESTGVYAGIAAPFNFNGLVRHYFLRRGPGVVDVQVNLQSGHERKRQSHDVALAARPAVDSIARLYGASAKIAEIPPGPPVLSTLVAEVYAADDETRLETARRVKAVFENTPGVVDVDWTVEAPAMKRTFRIDRVRAAQAGASVEQITRTLQLAMSGAPAAIAPSHAAREARLIEPQLALADRSSVESLLALPIATALGPLPLARFVSVEPGIREPRRMRRDLRPVIYVTGDVGGSIESPVYAIMEMNRAIDTLRVGGASVARYNATQPPRLDETAIKWDGEWQITIDMFRDLGIAFAVVLVLIYLLVVGWFRSFTVPLVIMAPIPLTLIGILPGHAATGFFFTATSMIGMIALAGIIVRNSILLVDFVQLEQRNGRPLRDALIEAGAVRFRPIALTAGSLVVGGMAMVLDPIFQGLAVSLISGAIVATLLTMIIVPLLYWELAAVRGEVAAEERTARVVRHAASPMMTHR